MICEAPDLPAPSAMRAVGGLVHHAEDGVGVAQQDLARMRQHHAARRAFEQLRTHLGFERLICRVSGG